MSYIEALLIAFDQMLNAMLFGYAVPIRSSTITQI